MVNADKVIEDQLLVAENVTNEQPEEHKARVNYKLKDILDARLFLETENKVRRESEQADQVIALPAAPKDVQDVATPLKDNQIFEDATTFLQQAVLEEQKKQESPPAAGVMSQPVSILRNNDLMFGQKTRPALNNSASKRTPRKSRN